MAQPHTQSQQPALANMLRIMELDSQIDTTRSGEIAELVAERILAAQSADDVFDAAQLGLESADDLLDVPIEILAISHNKSGFDAGLPVYTIVTAVDANGVKHVFSVGAITAQTQLFKWNELEKFPLVAVLIEKTSATSGNSVRLFRRPSPSELKAFAG